MQMAMAVGECTGEDADLLRRAMGSKRGVERIESLREKLYEGMATNGLVGEAADDIYAQDPGVRELRLRRVALAVVRAARLRELVDQAALSRRLPRGAAARAADGLLLARDAHRRRPPARRRGAAGPTCMRSGSEAVLEPVGAGGVARDQEMRDRRIRRDPPDRDIACDRCADRHGLLHPPHPAAGRHLRPAPNPTSPPPTAATGGFAVRLGLAAVKGIGATVAERIVAERERAGDYRDLRDLVRRAGVTAGAARGARDRGGVRVPRPHPPRGDLARRVGRPGPHRVPARFARRSCSRRCSPIRRATRGSPSDLWATGRLHRRPPDDPLPVRAGRAGSAHLERAARARVRAPRRGRGTRDAPATAGDGIRNHVHQPRRRARPRQRDLLGRGVEQATAGSCAMRRP